MTNNVFISGRIGKSSCADAAKGDKCIPILRESGTNCIKPRAFSHDDDLFRTLLQAGISIAGWNNSIVIIIAVINGKGLCAI